VLQQQLYDVRSDSLYMANLIDNQLREIEILRQEHQLKEQEIQAAALRMERNRVVRNSLIGGIGLVLAILGLLTYLFVSKRRSHRQLVAAYADLEITHRQLKMAQSQLVASEKMASLGQLTAGIAHEINNPVNFIAGNVVPLRNDLQDLLRVLDAYEQEIDEKGLEGAFPRTQALKQAVEVDYLRQEIPELMDGIEEGARRTTEIVRGLRVFARLDEDAVKRFDLHSGLDSTLTLVRNHAHKVEFVRHYGDLPLVEGFPGKLNQVFMNLLTNALQALPEEGGTITLTTLSHGLEVEIRVQDNGCGIPPEVRTRMFEPFYTTKEVGEGTGLGLAITLGIIKQHKGQIEIESEAGEGTTVIIRLPVDFIGDLEGEAPERMPSSGQVTHKA
jgi:two-component system, NtrC family, sensor kinase